MSKVRIVNLGPDPIEVGQPDGARASLGVNATGDFEAPVVVMPEADAAAFFNPRGKAPDNPEGANVPVLIEPPVIVLSEAGALADPNGTPRPDNPSAEGLAFAAGGGGAFDASPSSSDSSSSSSSD